MRPENTTELSYILTIVGIAFAIIGYVIYLNIRGDKSEEDNESDSEVAPEKAVDEAQDFAAELLTQPDPEFLSEGSPTTSSLETDEPENEKPDKDGKSSVPKSPSPEDQEFITVASILRQVDSGKIKLRVNDLEYESVDQLRETQDWAKISRLSTDLANWMKAEPQDLIRKSTTRSNSSPESKGPDSDNMIAQINTIIKEKTKDSEKDKAAISIVEGIGGALKVYIGVESFPFDDIPSEEVRELIRESVAEWEASQ
jgi:hypothetical protein